MTQKNQLVEGLSLRHLMPRVAAALLCLTAPAAHAVAEQAQAAVTLDSPAPPMLAAETAHIAKLDEMLAPTRNYTPDADVASRVKEAAQAVRAGNLAKVDELKAQIKDPVALKFIDWLRLRAGFGEAQEFREFLKNNPLWPERSTLKQRMEEALFTQGGTAAAIKDHFKAFSAETGIGVAALASAYLAEGNTAEARKLAAKAWREMPIPAMLENGFLNRFKDLLTTADHKWRFDRMVTDDVRWAGNRACPSSAAFPSCISR